MVEVHFTKPNEKSYSGFGWGKYGDSAVFISIDVNENGYSVNPSEEVSKEEREASDTIAAMVFYQEGSLLSLIEVATRALEKLRSERTEEAK